MPVDLFKPNNLSIVHPSYTHIDDPNMRDSVVEAITSFFPIEDGENIDVSILIEQGSFATKFRVGLRGEYYFLKCRMRKDEPQLLYDEAAKAVFLRKSNVPVPELIPAMNGDHVVERGDRCWIFYHFVGGEHFTGSGRELDNSAEGFGRLSLAVRNFNRISKDDIVRSTLDADELYSLLLEAVNSNLADQSLATLLLTYRKVVESHLDAVVKERGIAEAEYGFTHADFHPMNLLLKDENIVCILDFEDVKVYPILSALGFGAYKLIRQMLVNAKPEDIWTLSPCLVNRWLNGWQKYFPNANVTTHELAVGAKYRVLETIRIILHNYIRRGDSTCNYDLAKQIGSLFEIDDIFEGRSKITFNAKGRHIL